eukprot:TRINITY_DN6597_c0_g1_i1.p1 TRINITY_DN6597_c0_g1~~TRINITY_DN6597_c0_g1_i1.p1  ORF type:complete len:370 (-),score=106.47 TRINITY_DN6597_c0_g1_i1:135-1244(-)
MASFTKLIEPSLFLRIPAQDLHKLQPKVMAHLHNGSLVKGPLREEIQKYRGKETNEVYVKVAPSIELSQLREMNVTAHKIQVIHKETPFDCEGEDSWQPNFSDTHLGCGWQGRLGGQEELLIEQSSQLQQLITWADENKNKNILITREGGSTPGAGKSKAILFGNLLKDCDIDSSKEFQKPKGMGSGTATIYGDWFEGGPSVGAPLLPFRTMLAEKVITIYPEGKKFNVFCMTAPSCMALTNKPVSKDNIQDLLQTALTSYTLIRENCEKTPTVLGGYWGAGIFMNHPRVVVIVQLIAATCAGVTLQFHDFPSKFYPGHYSAAKNYFDAEILPKLEKGSKLGDIIDEFYEMTKREGWRYSRTNPVPNAT